MTPNSVTPQPDSRDVIVIGAGQAGGPLAGALARSSRRVTLIEKVHAGGTCVNEGCTPTKTMIASARVAHLARRAGKYGVDTGEVSVDFGRVQARKDAVVESFRSGSASGLDRAGVEVIMGHARFTGPHSVAVTDDHGNHHALEAPLVFINTGARPRWPDIPGLQDSGAVDSTGLLMLDQQPEHLLILGGGYIGLEFGQAFARFGSRVTIVEQAERLALKEDPDVVASLTAALQEDGVDFHFNHKAVRASRTAVGIELTIAGPQGEQVLSGTHLLVAAGRTANSDDRLCCLNCNGVG